VLGALAAVSLSKVRASCAALNHPARCGPVGPASPTRSTATANPVRWTRRGTSSS